MAVAVGAVIMEAVKASGAIVRLEPPAFERLVGDIPEPLVVRRHATFMGERWEYLVGHKGLVFYAKSKTPVLLPGRAEIIDAKTIWIPG